VRGVRFGAVVGAELTELRAGLEREAEASKGVGRHLSRQSR
jgi:hypothetical protein